MAQQIGMQLAGVAGCKGWHGTAGMRAGSMDERSFDSCLQDKSQPQQAGGQIHEGVQGLVGRLWWGQHFSPRARGLLGRSYIVLSVFLGNPKSSVRT